ncbi:MAG TPA: 4'-phosphopantetheinyl transferase superfamily protein [Bacteroidales bacterium]|nr:4'-phosphopantetheinyl transferase superfamily protein [Bacteroidales bacterium]
MPLHSNNSLNEHTRIVIWKIEETVEWFLAMLHLDREELEKYNGFRTDQRRAHWLAYRHILKNVVGRGSEICIRYDENSKPFIELSDDHISVSHAGKFAVVIISKQPVGIDIEQVTPRLHRIADKFLTPEETGIGLEKMSTEALCLHWCAKEALYKLYGERKLDFREHMKIIDPPGGMLGAFKGSISNGIKNQVFELVSEKIEDYFLVYALGHPGQISPFR